MVLTWLGYVAGERKDTTFQQFELSIPLKQFTVHSNFCAQVEERMRRIEEKKEENQKEEKELDNT